MFCTIINDCLDDNARGRQLSRVGAHLDASLAFVGVRSDLEAGLHLLDLLDATAGRRGLILTNVAPRGGHTIQWENGTPFGYFWYHDTLVVSTVDGYALAGVKQHLGIESIELLDLHTAAAAMEQAGFVPAEAAARIPHSQFRSYDFTPRVGPFLLQGHEVPSTTHPLTDVPALPPAIWHIDNFGNCKTTLTANDVAGRETIETRYGTLPIITRLRDVDDATEALITGSSGMGETRFLELIAQRRNFAQNHGAQLGDDIYEYQSHLVEATL